MSPVKCGISQGTLRILHHLKSVQKLMKNCFVSFHASFLVSMQKSQFHQDLSPQKILHWSTQICFNVNSTFLWCNLTCLRQVSQQCTTNKWFRIIPQKWHTKWLFQSSRVQNLWEFHNMPLGKSFLCSLGWGKIEIFLFTVCTSVVRSNHAKLLIKGSDKCDFLIFSVCLIVNLSMSTIFVEIDCIWKIPTATNCV